jgi:hypothetical protein
MPRNGYMELFRALLDHPRSDVRLGLSAGARKGIHFAVHTTSPLNPER